MCYMQNRISVWKYHTSTENSQHALKTDILLNKKL